MTKKTQSKANPVEEAMNANKEAWQSFWAASTESYEKMWGDANAQWQKTAFNYDDLAAFNQENVEVMKEVATVYTKGMEAMAAEWMAYGKSTFDANVKAAQAMAAAGTLKEAMEIQNDHVKTRVENWVAQGEKIGKMTKELAENVAKPVNGQVSKTVETMSKAAA